MGTAACRSFLAEGYCREDVHHEKWPKADYQDNLGGAYRELPQHKQKTCRDRHNEIHATTEPPERPDRVEMALEVLSSNKHQSSRVRRTARRAIEFALGENNE